MHKKRLVMICIFTFLLVITAEASMVSFIVIETGLLQDSERRKHSEIWENALFDAFFDAGYIVSNYPMMRFISIPDEDILDVISFNLDEAKDGGIDYILIVRLDYNSGVQAPQEVSFFIFKTSQHRIIYEKKATTNYNRPDREVTDSLKVIIRELIPFFNNF
jgi:hypothetical protein